jgi:flagellar protein FlaJ
MKKKGKTRKRRKIRRKMGKMASHIASPFRVIINYKATSKEKDEGRTKLQILAYRFLEGKLRFFLPLFKDLNEHMRKAKMRISFKAYVSLAVLTSFTIFISAMVATFALTVLILKQSFVIAVLLSIGISLLASASTIIGFYAYPIYRADSLRRKLEDELPFTTGYMAILAATGVQPDRMFHSLAKLKTSLATSIEAKEIVRNVKLFGFDMISALKNASKNTPSKDFRELLEGFIATIHSGGDLASYLRDKSMQYMKLNKIKLRKFSDTLSMLSEFYVTLMIVGPLLFIIMLSVIAMLGGSDFGILNPALMLHLITYIAIPVGSLVFLIILDAISPKW